jgi:hypothetical protein
VTSLRELQRAFARALTEPPSPQAAALVVAAGIPAERRLQVYRNNFLVTLQGALAAVYPVVRRLVGEGFFDHVARRYAREVPSTAGDIHAYGASFPLYLAQLPQTQGLPYLPDVARLEWTYHRVFHAADAHALGMECLANVPAERWSSLRLAVSPASDLLRSPYPVLRIWQVNQEDWHGEQTVHLDAGGDDVLVLRQGSGVELLALQPGELELLAALTNGTPLEQALDAALAVAPAFDLGVSLEKHFRLGTFVGLDFS